jgi:eukaryotic translation initiation factor 2C
LNVTFTYATEFNLQDLTDYIAKRAPNSPEVFQSLNFLNQVLADSLTRRQPYISMNRKYFPINYDERDVQSGGENSAIEFRRGFYQAIHWGGTTGLTVNFNVTTGIFWNSQMHTVIELALRVLGRDANDGASLASLHDDRIRELSRKVRGLKFFIKYRGEAREKQTHIATGISKESARQKTFQTSDGTRISVLDYYVKTYNLRLRFPDAPLVKKGTTFFPMEVCHIVPVYFPSFPDYSNLSFNVTLKSSMGRKLQR